jgi:hypothetical protein
MCCCGGCGGCLQVTEESLATFFADCGTVMDCRICGDPNSAMRFAFIEFLEELGAQQVRPTCQPAQEKLLVCCRLLAAADSLVCLCWVGASAVNAKPDAQSSSAGGKRQVTVLHCKTWNASTLLRQ